MPGDALEFMLADLRSDFEAESVPARFARLYDDDPDWGHMFGVLHKNLNQHFDDINGRIESTRHYWAENSRDLIKLTAKVEDSLHKLKRAGIDVEFNPTYEVSLEACRPWLSPSGGSPVPEDFPRIEVERYKPVFTRSTTTVKTAKQSVRLKLKMVGEGSYATVHSFTDPDYGTRVALKRARRSIGERDMQRFKAEFEYMKRLSHPHLVEVYRYDSEQNQYTMEFCDETLREYVAKRNADLAPSMRKKIALQFLDAIGYLHSVKILHRDISLQNVLLRVYGSGGVLVKVADFGLAKDQTQEFTLTNTEMRGTIRDPMLSSFKDYAVVNEMWSIAWVLSYIVTGRESLMPGGSPVGDIVQRCSSHRVADRYASLEELIADVEQV